MRPYIYMTWLQKRPEMVMPWTTTTAAKNNYSRIHGHITMTSSSFLLNMNPTATITDSLRGPNNHN